MALSGWVMICCFLWLLGYLSFVFTYLQENSDKSVIELQQYAKKNKPNLHILNKLQDEMRKLAKLRVCLTFRLLPCMLL